MNDILAKCKWVSAILLLSGCVHQMELSRQTTQKISKKVDAKSFWLKQSLFAGPFYDDDRFRLLHARPFDQINYLTMPDGKVISPPKEETIVPVGTRITVEKIEWPNFRNYLNRPLFSPRNLPWMKMTIAMERGKVSLMRDETYIFLLPISKENEEHFEAWFHTIFSEEDTNRWLLGLKEEIRQGVLAKRVVIGMNSTELLAALGEPDSLSKESIKLDDTNVTKEIATYPDQIVVLEKGIVTKAQALTPSTPAQFHNVSGNTSG